MKHTSSIAGGHNQPVFHSALLLLTLALVLPSAQPAFAQDVAFTQAPRDRQLFPRDANGAAPVVCSGVVSDPDHAAMMLVIEREGEFWAMDRTDLIYDPPHGAPFHLSCQISAGLAEYAASLLLDDELILVRDSLVCGDVLLINGQSNAMTIDIEGLATWQSEWLRTFGTSDPTAAGCMADSSWHLAQGHTYYTSAAIGVWGLCLGSWLIEDYGVPIAILNGAVSGTAILEHRRHDDDPENLHTIYGRLLWRARRAGVAQHARAMLWHQGEADTFGDWVYYAQRFDSLWSDWQEDYSSLEKTCVFQIHPGCGGEFQPQLREVQRILSDSHADVEVMATGGLPGHDGCHYLFEGYRQMARWVYRQVARDLYGSGDTWSIDAPNIRAAYYCEPSADRIRLCFDGEVSWPADTLGASLSDYVYLDGEAGRIVSGHLDEDGRSIILTLDGPCSASTITYLPNCCYVDPPGSAYQGPWIRNPRGVAALSFAEFPIAAAGGVDWNDEDQDSTPDDPVASPSGTDLRVHRASPNPFRGATRIRFSGDPAMLQEAVILEPNGRIVRRLGSGARQGGGTGAGAGVGIGSGTALGAPGNGMPGMHELVWDGCDALGRRVPAGAYIYLLRDTAAGGEQAAPISGGRVVLLR